MKRLFRYITLFLTVCLLFSANLFSQIDTIYYPNGKISSVGMMRDGKPDGFWKSYYVTGMLKSEGNRINFLMDSTWVFYTQTGDTSEIINYRLGKKSGYYYQFETQTQRNQVSRHFLKSKEMFLDNKREGASYYYYPSGKLRQIINYKNGRSQGFSKIFDENGDIITLEEYHNGSLIAREHINRVNANGEKHGVWKTFHPNGELKTEEYYKNGVLDGATILKSEKGTTIDQRVYRDGNLIEAGIQMIAEPIDLTSYWEDGVTIKRRGSYLDSIPIGDHIYYNSSGVSEKIIRYNEKGIRVAEGILDANGRRNGDWNTYFETGELRLSGKYANNAPVGEWTHFTKDGKKMQTGYYSNRGLREGEWRWYYPSGDIFREEVYVDDKPNGLCVQYSDSATIVAKGEYVDGKREGFWVENVGDSREEGNYIMGEKNGMWKTWYKNGQLHHSGNFVQGYPDGRHVIYYPDGTLKEEQFYVMGRRDKTWKKYYENGSLFLTITYRNDVEVRINGIRIDDSKK